MKFLKETLIVLVTAISFLANPLTASAATLPYTITAGIPGQSTTPGATFLTVNFNIDYQSGQIIFSGNPDGTGNTWVDDAAVVWVVRRPDGTSDSVTYRYDNGCAYISQKPPQNVTSLFKLGVNQVQVRLYDVCGRFVGSSPLYLVNTNAPDPTPTPTPAPEPFLDLPWDYEGKGLSFNEAAHSMTSYFDHSYPLLSSGLTEIVSVLNQITTFENENSTTKNYSSHDGYDYAKVAKVNIGDPVLAAAAGEATYVNTCGACGNMILIDHGNGYQTRYLHLQKAGLITNVPGQKVQVTAHQPIGKVGVTGNVSPPGDAGAHIHFGVFQDKNKDGNFDDNIPDGVTDPFGWQSKDPDPWPNFTFNYLGQQRTGNRSYYLWIKKLDNLDSTLTANGGVFKTSRSTINFPAGATNQTLNINIQSSPIVEVNNILSSIGSTIVATAKDALGNLVTNFQAFFTITIDFNGFDLSRYKTDTISIYSSPDNINWTKEKTTVNWTEKTASATLNHFSYFALMAERLDTTSPETSAILTGQQGHSNWFRSDVQVTLDARDNEGGLGVDYVMYKLPDGDWEIYESPLTFTNEGHYKIEFYSADNDENLETIKSVEFDIDKTLPDALIDASPKNLWPPDNKIVDITANGSSSDSHLSTTSLIVDDEYDQYDATESVGPNFSETIQLEAKRDGGDLNGRMYIIKAVAEDLAGNKTEKQVAVIVPHDQGKNK